MCENKFNVDADEAHDSKWHLRVSVCMYVLVYMLVCVHVMALPQDIQVCMCVYVHVCARDDRAVGNDFCVLRSAAIRTHTPDMHIPTQHKYIYTYIHTCIQQTYTHIT
jgi:hypothetical protein